MDTSEPLPTTEAVNPASVDLDTLSASEFVRLMNAQDAEVVRAVAGREAEIAAVIDAVAACLRSGGRLFYVGAGTSGRLGVLDASECPPTFSCDPELVQGLIAGGDFALRNSVEDAEDDPEQGAEDLRSRGLTAADAVIGIAASGTTPYVLGAIRLAHELGACTASITCNEGAPLSAEVAHPVVVVVGPEILAGSTRLKAGTATKMVLNMISTGVMVKLGKTYGNLMVDVRASNRKLVVRTVRLLRHLSGLDEAAAVQLLGRCDGELKVAAVVARLGVEPEVARQRLVAGSGSLRAALN